jgi:hypothetical protein
MVMKRRLLAMQATPVWPNALPPKKSFEEVLVHQTIAFQVSNDGLNTV